MSVNILKYESDVWRTADLLIGAGIKQSDFSKYMMPYFALLMVESRLIREARRLSEEIGKDNMDDFVEMFQLEGLGYNDYLIRKGKSLKDICQNDTTERFVALPSISDGQFLFTQHILYHLANDGLSVVVHNGSTLFSGDAGSGESTIRKHFFDNDWVEAIIQMPTDEFFNTGIYTYLWVFNKNKPADRKDKVILINDSELYEPLKKARGKKRRQMNPANRAEIVKAFSDFKDNDFTRINLKMEKVNDFLVYIPDTLSAQEEIVKFLDAKLDTIAKIITNIQTQITTLKELRKTLINDVVTGKIKVTP